MNNNNNNNINRGHRRNKLTAMMIIFITASPIGSLIRILMLLYQYFYPNAMIIPEEHRSVSSSSSSGSSAMSYLHDLFLPRGNFNSFLHNIQNTTTIEAMLESIIRQYAIPINTFHPNSAEKIHQDLQMVIPWIFAFTTLIIIPLSMIVCNALWRRNDMEINYRKERMKIYQRCLDDFQMVLCSKDIIIYIDDDDDDDNHHHTTTDNNENDMIDKEDTYIIIPKPGVQYNPSIHHDEHDNFNNPQNTRRMTRQITGTCAICLSTYDKGETVVWSSYVECPHVYHLNCINTWIQKTCTTSCPCCRRDFIDSGLYHKLKYEKKK